MWYRAATASWQGVTIATYLWAALHKLNRDFLAPQTSCAHYGWEKLLDYWHLGVTLPPVLDGWLPWAVIATELGIALGLALGLRRVVWPLAVAFHIPLTVTMAPAFALVMAAGHASFLTQDDLTHYTTTLRTHRLAWPYAPQRPSPQASRCTQPCPLGHDREGGGRCGVWGRCARSRLACAGSRAQAPRR